MEAKDGGGGRKVVRSVKEKESEGREEKERRMEER